MKHPEPDITFDDDEVTETSTLRVDTGRKVDESSAKLDRLDEMITKGHEAWLARRNGRSDASASLRS